MPFSHETEPLTKRLRENPTDADPAVPVPHEIVSRMVRERLEAAAEIERLQGLLDAMEG